MYIHVIHRIEKRIKFKVKTGNSLELLRSESMNLCRRTDKKITKDKKGENILKLLK